MPKTSWSPPMPWRAHVPCTSCVRASRVPPASLHHVQVQNADAHVHVQVHLLHKMLKMGGWCTLLARTTHRVCRYPPYTMSSCSRTDPSVEGTNPCLRKAFLPYCKLEAKRARLWGTPGFYPTSTLCPFLSALVHKDVHCSLSSPNLFLTLKITCSSLSYISNVKH